MHKDIPVADMDMITSNGSLVDITQIHNIKHAPVGTATESNIGPSNLDKWLTARSIPASRQNLDELLQELRITNSSALALKSYGVSLSDHYWLKPTNQKLTWEQVNFYENDFSDDIGEFLIQGMHLSELDLDVRSPDNNANGVLKKKWVIQEDKRILMKGGYEHQYQEPFNEIIASNIMERLNIPHTSYKLGVSDRKPYSFCDNFTTINIEYVTAHNIMDAGYYIGKLKTLDPMPIQERLPHMLKSCEALGIENAQHYFNQMMVIDYLIANTDRHFTNFGFLRDSNTLEWEGFAPIFDSGTSLWNRGKEWHEGDRCRTFARSHSDQIKLITDLSWYEPISQAELAETVTETLSLNKRIGPKRRDAITKAVIWKSGELTQLKKELLNPTVQVKQPKVNTSPTHEVQDFMDTLDMSYPDDSDF